MKYLGLLRGINVGGNNKVSMPELRACFEEAGFMSVQTYINSGNIIFESELLEVSQLTTLCERIIEEKFGFRVVCAVIAAPDFVSAVADAPSWWANGPGKHNAIIVIPPKTVEDVMASVGPARPEYEQIASSGQVLFWSAPLETFSRTRYRKIVGTDMYRFITIRNANTTLKLAELCK